MIPTVTVPGPTQAQAPAQPAQKAALPQPDAARSSAGENAAANVRAETARAIDAPEQSSVAPRLREQETKERPDAVVDGLVGPEPTFEESPLERQARVALDPPEVVTPREASDDSSEQNALTESDALTIAVTEVPAFEDPPPTPTERAETSFAETRTLSSDLQPATIDIAR